MKELNTKEFEGLKLFNPTHFPIYNPRELDNGMVVAQNFSGDYIVLRETFGGDNILRYAEPEEEEEYIYTF